jgi:hypothetical protein
MSTQLETIHPTMNILSALKKLHSRSGEGTDPLLAFDLFSVEPYLHPGKVTHAQGCTSKFQRLQPIW